MDITLSGHPRLVLDLGALKRNYRAIKEWVGPSVKVMGVVKSDAYGHGILPVSLALEEEAVDFLGVFDTKEALYLREQGVRAPICVLTGPKTREEAHFMVRAGLVPILFDLESAEVLNGEALAQGAKAHFFLKVDTGMGRLGLFIEELQEGLDRVRSLEGLKCLGLASHLSSADEEEGEFSLSQIALFEKAISLGRQKGFSLPLNHISNSAGTLRYKTAHFEMVRVGIWLYGSLPRYGFESTREPEPVMSLKGEVLQVRYLPPNTPVSYCRTYYTQCPTKVAVVSIGYGDGIPRSLSNRGYCLIQNTRALIIGNVCMNLTILDVEGIRGVQKGDEVVFLGRQGEEVIRAEELAFWSGTIPYEIMCSIGSRNKRCYSK